MEVFFPDKLIIKASWLIEVRWIIGVCAGLAISVGCFFSIVNLDYFSLYFTASLLFLLNFIYYLDIKRIRTVVVDTSERIVKRNINFQIAFDFIILAVLLHFSGGIENPCILFFIFHMIIGSIILPSKNAYFLALLAIFLFLTLTVTEYFGILEHHSINKYFMSMISNEPLYFFSSQAIFVFTSFIAVYLAVNFSGQLRLAKMLLSQNNQGLLEKDKIKNEFIKRVTHDIRNELATVSSCLSVVDKQILEPVTNQNADFVYKALKRTKKLTLFVNDILTLTNLKLDNRFETSIFSLSEVVNNVINRVKSEVEVKNIELLLKMEDDSLTISGIKVSFEEALSKLVQNAVKYTPSQGKVCLEIKKKSEIICIVVSDNGYGIPEKDLSYVFDEFYRGENIKSIEGNGLGLSLVKAIVDRHNGSINVKSKLNSGTTFTLLFNAK